MHPATSTSTQQAGQGCIMYVHVHGMYTYLDADGMCGLTYSYESVCRGRGGGGGGRRPRPVCRDLHNPGFQ